MTEGGVDTRAATVTDVADIAAVEAAAFEHPWTADALRAMLQDGLTHAFIATHDDAVVGAAVVRVVAGEGELLRIAVVPQARRRGVARVLLRDVIDAVGGACPDGLHLEVRASNAAARALYETAGFVESGRRHGYYQHPAEDAVLMRWTRGLTGVDREGVATME
ncbi:MAG TPA: ribosomal protein S18-alanine N-acetyltransferase [Luteitalea sp.]|nr:ribosomal protein S18-alanine N-acetyltransferase [Luteitalea sp.]